MEAIIRLGEVEFKNVRIATSGTNQLYIPLDYEIADKLEESGWTIRTAGPETWIDIYKDRHNPVEVLNGVVNVVLIQCLWSVGDMSGVKAYIKSVVSSESANSVESMKRDESVKWMKNHLETVIRNVLLVGFRDIEAQAEEIVDFFMPRNEK